MKSGRIRQIRHAIDSGVNYFDTAPAYHFGKSEQILGKALQDGYREKVRIATKLPHWSVRERADMDRILAGQLATLKTDHIDYYLLHSLGQGELGETGKTRRAGVPRQSKGRGKDQERRVLVPWEPSTRSGRSWTHTTGSSARSSTTFSTNITRRGRPGSDMRQERTSP